MNVFFVKNTATEHLKYSSLSFSTFLMSTCDIFRAFIDLLTTDANAGF